MELEISVLSKAGGRAINEDACGVWSHSNMCFCVLSDGAGGHGGGEVASRLVVSEVLAWFKQHPECNATCIRNALVTANRAVVKAQATNGRLANMRATVVVLAIDTENGKAIWGHLGDTRLYCFRKHEIVIQTLDHSVVQSMVDAGYIKSTELRKVPQRNRLLAAMGDRMRFEPHIEEKDFQLSDGDVFLLCTDGCWEHIEEADMSRTLQASSTNEEWLKHIEGAILSVGKEGQDNYSALVISCKDADDFTTIIGK